MSSKAGYWLAAAIAIAGAIAGVVWWNVALVRVTDAVNDFQRVRRGTTVNVDEAGAYTIWAQRPCGGYCVLEPAGAYRRHIDVSFSPAGSEGTHPEITAHPRGGHYNVGSGRQGRAVWLVEFPEPGDYTLDVRSDGEVLSPALRLGQGESLPARILAPAVWIAGTGIAAGTVIAAAVFLRERRRAAGRRAELPF